jgi:microcystin-dependent protein
MPCGCTSACGCNLVPGDNVTIDRLGDTFTISATGAIVGVEDTDCIDLVIDVDKILTANPILSPDPGSVDLECTPSGIAASVVVDPASTAIVSEGPSGLRVDIPPPPATPDGWAPGDALFFMGFGVRAGFLDADGSDVDRVVYQALWDAVSLMSTTAGRTLGSPIITGLASTRLLEAGMPVEATGFAPLTTVVSVDSASQITVSTNATSDGTPTEVRVYPYGNGDGISSFNVPDFSARFPLGFDYAAAPGTQGIGSTGGSSTYSLTAFNLPLHDHPATVGGTASVATAISGAGSIVATTSTEAAHTHSAPSGRNFVTIDTPTNVGIANDAPDTLTIVLSSGALDQLNNASTAAAGNHDHSVSIPAATIAAALSLQDGAVNLASVTVDVGDAGTATPADVDTIPPFIVGRWMVHV